MEALLVGLAKSISYGKKRGKQVRPTLLTVLYELVVCAFIIFLFPYRAYRDLFANRRRTWMSISRASFRMVSSSKKKYLIFPTRVSQGHTTGNFGQKDLKTTAMNKAFGSHFKDFGGLLGKFICSSLSARLMKEFSASKVHLQPATWLTGKFPSRRTARHYWQLWVWS